MSNKQSTAGGVEHILDLASKAIPSAFPAGTVFQVNGAKYTSDELVAKLDSFQSYYGGVRQKRADLRAVLEDRRRNIAPEVRLFLPSLKQTLGSMLGVGSSDLEKFGFAPPKPRTPLTSEQLLARAAKSKVTRAKRQTLGSRQKQSLRAKGDPTITVTPAAIDLPAASAPSAGDGTAGAAKPADPGASPPASAPAPKP